ncbi:MAG TPA: hypothetical protein VHA56_20810 [Mucilaginibacter sp.]|nr:hypothetical protein [Mucilaginibacter sp.]
MNSEPLSLSRLGDRICIIGPSNSGKSTLAQKLGEKLSLPVYHLDQFAHVPGTNWMPRKKEDWVSEHDRFIEENSWIIEGNYSFCMAQRFKRASYVIWLDFNTWGCVRRYIARSLKADKTRPGRLDAATGDFNFGMIPFILFTYPRNREKYQKLIADNNVPVESISSISELNKYYHEWKLSR